MALLMPLAAAVTCAYLLLGEEVAPSVCFEASHASTQ